MGSPSRLRPSKSRAKLSFAREPLSFHLNPPDDFGLRGGDRDLLRSRVGDGAMFGRVVSVECKKMESFELLFWL